MLSLHLALNPRCVKTLYLEKLSSSLVGMLNIFLLQNVKLIYRRLILKPSYVAAEDKAKNEWDIFFKI